MVLGLYDFMSTLFRLWYDVRSTLLYCVRPLDAVRFACNAKMLHLLDKMLIIASKYQLLL